MSSELIKFNYESNTSTTLPIYWASSPLNFASQPGVFAPLLYGWTALIGAQVLLGIWAKHPTKLILCLILASTSGISGLLWLDLLLVHVYLGFSDFQPDPGYWWAEILLWLVTVALAVAAFKAFRASKKKDPTD
ncbi:MAG: hypothetical protein KA500_04235 [Rhodoluna sp.]|nr:hypothetical protein [Rhodoluna sp.]